MRRHVTQTVASRRTGGRTTFLRRHVTETVAWRRIG